MTSESALKNRHLWIDHLRSFVFALLVLDHCAHAYARDFGRFHFFKDFERGLLGDILYLHNNSIIMPLLFFIFGLFIFPSIRRHGVTGYLKKRLPKLIVPYIIGIPLIVPLLVFPRYQYLTNPLMSYTEFWQGVYFQEKLQGGGPFWVLYCLLLFTLVAITLSKVLPSLVPSLGKLFNKAVQRPVPGICIFLCLSILILGGSDLKWGAPWWIGFGHLETNGDTFWVIVDKVVNLFHLQGSRFLLHALYFTTGIAVSASGCLDKPEFWHHLSRRWPLWTTAMIVTGLFYCIYTLTFFYEGAYSDAVHRAIRFEGFKWHEAWPLVIEHGPGVLIRTSFHGIFCFFQAMTYISLFYRFVSRPNAVLCHLAACSYGIFLLHEVPVIWGQYFLAGSSLPILIKIFLLFAIGGGLTWAFVGGIRKVTLVRKIIG